MPLPKQQQVRPEYAPPKDVAPSHLVQMLLSRGRPPFAVVDYPRFDDMGEPICKVMLRLLTVTEEDIALARARQYVSRLLKEGTDAELSWKPEELEHNARIAELLAVSCRDPDNPEKPFFEFGVFEMRQHCTSDELGVLANVYASLKESTHPRLQEMNEAELEAWVRVVAEGAMSFPFSYLPRGSLERLTEFCVEWLAELGAFTSGPNQTSSSTSGS